MLQQTFQFADLLLSSFALGATVWFFFVQTPVLIRTMGRDKFVPIMMRLTRVHFKVLSLVLFIVLLLAILHGGLTNNFSLIGAVVALIGAATNHFFVVPRALRAGGRGRMDAKDPADDKSIGTFAAEGSGPSAKFWHRTVIAFVAVILIGLVPHIIAV
jgi:hypothetical protein